MTTANTVATPPNDACSAPSRFIDSDHPEVVEHAAKIVADAGARTDREKAVALFLAVRDGWRYDPYGVSYDQSDYTASAILRSSSSWCVPKSVLLTALCRAAGIPAALGFADVRNHLQSEKLQETMGTDLFVFHGYSLIWIDGAWRKASSAFNRELCERFGTKVLDFDGTTDALMHPFDEAGNRHMEYVDQRGEFEDLPFDLIFATFDEVYGDAFKTVSSGTDGAFVE
ncbi:transglutaminase-like domain-containing protein [Cumulibacter soli]|uniref:transglutaminase-like domain-containing protein n=1 Tax=Cumulibacter soli TaxID=2546344 RepID=UPI001067783E|nr:transglutaminase family protein [Cumulibacter soli]